MVLIEERDRERETERERERERTDMSEDWIEGNQLKDP